MIAYDVGIWVFFFKQKSAYEMRISDWSSDVCSSDLCGLLQAAQMKGADQDWRGLRRQFSMGASARQNAASRKKVMPPVFSRVMEPIQSTKRTSLHEQ